jgi:PPOX class probable F420-dependent enzyme
MNPRIPASFHALIAAPSVAVLSTTQPDGAPHAVPVWYDYDDTHLYITTGTTTVKYRNLVANPWAVVLFVDPVNTDRYCAVHTRLVDTSDAATGLAHLHVLAQRYMGVPEYPYASATDIYCRLSLAIIRCSSLG